MVVFVVVWVHWDSHEVRGVFSSQEAAQLFIDKQRDPTDFYIEECELDSLK